MICEMWGITACVLNFSRQRKQKWEAKTVQEILRYDKI